MQEAKVQRTAEPLCDKDLPKTPYITLDNLISLIATHGVEIPEGEAKQIEDFIEKRISSSPMAQFQRGLLLTSVLESLYRRWFAASRLHWELMEHAERSPKWRNWSRTGQPVRLDAEDRKRAMTMLERMIAYNQDRFNDFLSGRELLIQQPAIADSAVFDAADRKWLSGLGFETDEILGFFRAEEAATEQAGRPLQSNRGASESPCLNIEDSVRSEMVADGVGASSVTHKPLREKQRRNELDDAIDKAIASTGSYNTSTVWQALRELALNEESPFTGVIDRDGALLYTKDRLSTGDKEPSRFTKNALDNRLNRRWDALKKSGRRH
ncbi:hypothetical protein [Burkholderia arboris]|uniref:hypothetical protein n=1 Tax=Burkholderia arboris TaxID=488730 RepID=UPI00158CEF82|nr:hypothetical protein [Burkholderia arboris]